MSLLSGDSIPHIYITRNIMSRSCLFRTVQSKRNLNRVNKVWCGMQKYAKIQCFGQLARKIIYPQNSELDTSDYCLQQPNFKRLPVPKEIPFSSMNMWSDATAAFGNERLVCCGNEDTVSQVGASLDLKSEDGSNLWNFGAINGFHQLDAEDIDKSSNLCDMLKPKTPNDSETLSVFPSDDNTSNSKEMVETGTDLPETHSVAHSLPPTPSNVMLDTSHVSRIEVSGNPLPQAKKTDSLLVKIAPTNNSQNGSFLSNDDVKKIVDDNIHLEVEKENIRAKICAFYDKVLIVDSVSLARQVVKKLTTEYRHLVHACDTEVANIDVKRETPVGHGEIMCFSIYSGPVVDLGNGKCCVWVDVLDGGGCDIVQEFAPFFENSSIQKVWHNYSFDAHILENHGVKLSGFHADTMHMARLWNPSRLISEGGYSLEALTNDKKIFSAFRNIDPIYNEMRLSGKVSMKVLFGAKKIKKDGTPGKMTIIPPVRDLQLNDRKHWICYSALDTVNTLVLYEFMKNRLSSIIWCIEGIRKGSMLEFYFEYWRPFGNLLVEMETEGMLVDRQYLSEIEKVAIADKQACADKFRNWASEHCPDAKYMNVGSDTQIRVLFFGGTANRKDNEIVPLEKTFKVPNVHESLEADSKNTGSKFRSIMLKCIVEGLDSPQHTLSGWPSVSNDALRVLSGKVYADSDFEINGDANHSLGSQKTDVKKVEEPMYGTAYAAFGGGKAGVKACRAISTLCEISSIDSLISNFILPLQGSDIVGKTGRIHCSLNINTETGRLSARNPNLQNQPAFEKDLYKIRQAFVAAPGNSLIVADYGQLELRLLAHLSNCKSMLEAFEAGGDFHSRTALNMYSYIRDAVDMGEVILERDPTLESDKPRVPLLKDAFASERRKAKMLNFSIAYGKTPAGLARDWKVSYKEAESTVELWYKDRKEVLTWQEKRKKEVHKKIAVKTLLGRSRHFPSHFPAYSSQEGHILRAAINSPVQGSAADVAMCAMLELSRNTLLKELGWKLLLQVHDEMILEGPTESSETAKAIVINCMTKPFGGRNILNVDLSVDAKCARNWYSAK